MKSVSFFYMFTRSVLLLIVISTSTLFQLKAECTNCREADSLALVSLYNATNGPMWENNTGWLSGSIDTWAGVTFRSGRVEALALQYNKLNGVIPDDFFNLTNLLSLYLNNNQIHGVIPSSFSKLTLIRNLNLSNNQFSFTDLSNTANFVSKTNYVYNPQALLPSPQLSYNGAEITLTVTDNHPQNHYTWYINGSPVLDYDFPSFTFTPTSNTMVYVSIKNDIFTIAGNQKKELILSTYPLLVEPAQLSISLFITNPPPVCEPNTVDLTKPEITIGSSNELTLTYYSDASLSIQLSSEQAQSIIVPGTYYIKGTDAYGTSDTKPVIVTINSKPVLTIEQFNVSCINGNDGSFDLTASGGLSPYKYRWSNGSTNEDIDHIMAGEYWVSVIDNNGCEAIDSSSIIQFDPEFPVAIAQNITIQLDENGFATITAEQIDNGSTDNCDIASIQVSPSDFDCSNIGQNTVTLTVTDVNGNSATTQAAVTIEDKITPFVVAQNSSIALDENGTASITAYQIDNGSSDNCEIANMTIYPSVFGSTNVGENTVTLTVTDVNGNTASTNAIVTVSDITAPTIIPQNIIIALNENGTASIVASQIDNGSSDNAGILSMTVSPSDFDCGDIGNNIVTLTVTDVNGNSSTAQAIVTVEDKTVPVAIAKNITVQLGSNGSVSVTAALIDNGSTDNCGIASIQVSPSDFDCSTLGENTVTLTVTDINGNSATTQAIVTVEDRKAPIVVAQNSSIALDENGTASITAYQIDNGSSDNCEIANMTIYPSVFGSTNVGENTVTLTVTDVNGNTASANSIVSVSDITAPKVVTKNTSVALDENGTVSVCALQIDNGSSDACGIAQMVVSPCIFSAGNIGENTVTLTVTDVNGNSASANAIVTVSEITAPTVITQNIIIALNENGASSIVASQIDNGSSDNAGILSMTVSPSDFDCGDIGDNIVTLTVTDVNGNTASANATVTVEDKTVPVAIAKNITVQLGSNGSVSVSAAQINNSSTDNCGIASIQVSQSDFDCSKIGQNTVILTVTDVNGNSSTAQAIVTVEDKIAPTIIAPPSITQNAGTRSSSNDQTSDFSSSSSNQTNCITGGTTVQLGSPVVSDNCTVKKVTNNAPSAFQIGLTVVTWTVTDVNGNSSSATQNVTITNNPGTTNKIPVINSISSNSPVYRLNSAKITASFTDENLKTATLYWGDGTSSAGKISGSSITGSHNYRETGLYDVTLTITDQYGKSATKVYSYIVVFDPANGDVTGGGWMNTERGDYLLKSSCEKGNFGFSAKYDKNNNLKGNLTFHLNGVNFHVKSTSLDWLLVGYDHAIFKGRASVNGTSGYEFLVSAIDIDMNKSCGKADDLLRIIVWNSRGEVIFDNQCNSSTTSRPTDPINQGSIVIHGSKKSNSSPDKSLEIDAPSPENVTVELFKSMKIYPNPAVKVLHIEIPERTEQFVSFDIVDVTGRVITKENQLELYGQYSWIDLEQFSMNSGVYILRLKQADGTQTSQFRFIKK